MHWVCPFIQESHTCQPQKVLRGLQLFALWSGRLSFSLSRCLLAATAELSTVRSFPLDPKQLLRVCVCMCVIYCSATAGSSPDTDFSTCDSGGIRYWTSSVLIATLSGWSHLLKCSKVLGKSKRKGWLHQTSKIIPVTQYASPPTTNFFLQLFFTNMERMALLL